MNSRVVWALVLSSFLAISSSAADSVASPPLEWLTSRKAAVEKARAEGRLVFVAYRPTPCSDCARLVKAVAANATMRRLAMQFVLLDTPPLRTGNSGMDRKLSFALLDQTGRDVLTWRGDDEFGRVISRGQLGDILFVAEAAAPFFWEAADLDAQGKPIDALLARALAFREAGYFDVSVATYRRAVDEAKKSGDKETTQTAEILLELALAGGGSDLTKSIAAVRVILAEPASKSVESKAWLALSQLLRAAGDERGATEAVEHAGELRAAEDGRRAAEAREQAGGQDVSGGIEGATAAQVVGGDRRVIRLLIPGSAPYRGKTTLQVLARDPNVAAVTFLVDGADLFTDSEPPFAASVNLGTVPRRHELRIVARSPSGEHLGEDTVVLNDRHDDYWVHAAVEGMQATATVHVPAGQSLEHVEFYLDDRLIAARSEAPYAVSFANENPANVLRVVATLEGGRVAEDAVVLAGGSELVVVQEVEMFATVVGADDQFVRGLTESQFRILEEGQPRPLLQFEALEHAPFTAGLAIDSSTSMRARMLDVQESAARLLEQFAGEGNPSFLVDFNTRPRLAAATTTDAKALRTAVASIRAGGSTALYDGIVFSLLQLQGVPGKRTLVVLSDGADTASRYRVADVVRVARETGAAIYVILLSRLAPGGLRTLAEETGGRVFTLRSMEELDAIYTSIHEELGSQYRFVFRTAGQERNEYRRVKITTSAQKATVRTAAGFITR
jgi:Ca-activated chloride channel family protein